MLKIIIIMATLIGKIISRQITKLQYFRYCKCLGSEELQLQHKFIMIPVDFEEAVFLSCFRKKKKTFSH